jgi:hypothetical protein
LQKKPADRFPSAAALHAALTNALPNNLSNSIPSVIPEPAPTPPARNRKVPAILAAVALGLVIAIVAIVLSRPKHTDEQAKGDNPDAKGGQPTDPAKPPDGAPGNPGVPNPAKVDPPGKPPEKKDDLPKKVDPQPVRAEPELFTLNGHTGRAWVTFAPDNRSLVSWGDDQTIRVWDATTGKPGKVLVENSHTMAVAVSRESKVVAAALGEGTARLWTLPDWEEKVIYRDSAQGISAIVFSPDGTKLALGTDGGAVKIFDWKTGKELADCVGHSQRIHARALYFTPDGKRLLSASRDDSIRVWDVATGKKEYTVADRKEVWAIIPTPNPDQILSIEKWLAARKARVLDLKTGKVVKDLGERWVSDFALSSDGKHLWSIGSFGLDIWDLTALKVAVVDKEIRGNTLALLPGEKHMLVGGEYYHETRLIVLKVEALGADRLRTVQEHRKHIISLCVSSDGKLAATGDESGVIKVWDVPSLTHPK